MFLVSLRLISHILDFEVLQTTLVAGVRGGQAQLLATLVVIISGFLDSRATQVLLCGANGCTVRVCVRLGGVGHACSLAVGGAARRAVGVRGGSEGA